MSILRQHNHRREELEIDHLVMDMDMGYNRAGREVCLALLLFRVLVRMGTEVEEEMEEVQWGCHHLLVGEKVRVSGVEKDQLLLHRRRRGRLPVRGKLEVDSLRDSRTVKKVFRVVLYLLDTLRTFKCLLIRVYIA